MRTDELRHDLEDLADELTPFEFDVRRIRRRVVRGRVVVALVAAVALALPTAALGARIAGGGTDEPAILDHGRGTKEFAHDISIADVDVVLEMNDTGQDAIDEMRGVLDDLDSVGAYGLTYALGDAARADLKFGAECNDVVYLVVTMEPRFVTAHSLSSAVPGPTTVVDARRSIERWHEGNVRITMNSSAPAELIDNVGAVLEADPDVESFRHLSKDESYEEFSLIFSDEPLLVQETTPDLLPTSFRVKTAVGVEPTAIAPYEAYPGVSSVTYAPTIELTDEPVDGKC